MNAAAVDEVKAAVDSLGIDVRSISAVAGGDISAAFRVECGDGRRLFVKCGEPGVLAAEATGLRALSDAAHTLIVPHPEAHFEAEEGLSFLVLEWLERVGPTEEYWASLGRGLAALHRTSLEQYGFHEDNFIGRRPQPNAWCSSWSEFFAERRLEPQVRMLKDTGAWESSWSARYAHLVRRLPELIPAQPLPSLVHGDLWAGNAMATVAGPAVVDPAAHYGDREVDLAMTELFGGFSPVFYAAYREAFPLDAGYARRRDLYNLYHLLNHLNHFGSTYAGSVDRALRDLGA
jgi:fructosamine-3-kinase